MQYEVCKKQWDIFTQKQFYTFPICIHISRFCFTCLSTKPKFLGYLLSLPLKYLLLLGPVQFTQGVY